jgi:hypothetical protein
MYNVEGDLLVAKRNKMSNMNGIDSRLDGNY